MKSITLDLIAENEKIIDVELDSLTIIGNINNLILLAEIKTNVIALGGLIDKGRSISFSYDYSFDICYCFHDENLRFYNSYEFPAEHLDKLEQKLNEIYKQKLLTMSF